MDEEQIDNDLDRKEEGKGLEKGKNAFNKGKNALNKGKDLSNKAKQAKKAKDAAKAAKTAANTAKAAKGAGFLAGTPVGWVILGIAVFVLIVVILIGIISFFMTMPGMVRDSIVEFVNDLWTKFKSFWVGTAEGSISTEQVVGISNRLEEMGYDLVGYGFMTASEYEGITREETEENSVTSKGKIVSANSQLIKDYLFADNLTYVIENCENNMLKFTNWITGQEGKYEGMIKFETFELSGVDGEGGTAFNWNEFVHAGVETDRESQSLRIKMNTWKLDFWNSYTDNWVYGLDGWIGRYGKPVDFLLTLHMATLAPDFVSDVALGKMGEEGQIKDTKVHLRIFASPAEVEVFYKGVPIDTLDSAVDSGITEESGNGGIVQEWQELPDDIKNEARKRQGDMKVGQPYITSVRNHWYRDLDFPMDCYEAVYIESGETVNLKGEEGTVMADFTMQLQNYWVLQQVAAPFQVGTRGEDMRKLLTEKEYYIYDGTLGTAKKIEEGSAKKRPVIQEEVTDEQNKQAIQAVAMLESTHTQDAQCILRDFKELFEDVGYEFESDGLDWSVIIRGIKAAGDFSTQDSSFGRPGENTENDGSHLDNSPELNEDGSIKNEKLKLIDLFSQDTEGDVNANTSGSPIIVKSAKNDEFGFSSGVILTAFWKTGEVIHNTGNAINVRLGGEYEGQDIVITISGFNAYPTLKGTVISGASIGTSTDSNITITVTEKGQNVDPHKYIEVVNTSNGGYIRPVNGGYISYRFNQQQLVNNGTEVSKWLHGAVDIAVPAETDVYASRDGKVIKVGYDANGYGHYVIIAHDGGMNTLYAHGNLVLVSLNQTVKQGETIMKSGSTGNSNGPHLHFEMILNGTKVDPEDYIDI